MLRKLNIHKKLALVLWGSALTAFAIAGFGLAIFQKLTLEHRAMQAMEPYARLVSVSAEGAVAFEDPVRAQEILDTLRSNHEIREAAIVLEDGRVLAGFGGTANAKSRPSAEISEGIRLSGDTAELRQGLPHDARLRLVMGLDRLNAETHQMMWLLCASGLVLLGVTLGQLAVLRRAIIRPITTLAEAAEMIRSRGDYDQNVPTVGDDEVGRLGRSFKAMMEALRERERELRRLALSQRTIVESAAYGIISTTADGLVTSFNPAAERILGYAADEIIGRQTPDIWHDPEEVAQRARQVSEALGKPIEPGFDVFAALARNGLADENEWTFIRRDGTRVPVLLSVTALREETGLLTGFVGLVSDLSERKRAEEALRYSEEFLRITLENILDPVFMTDDEGGFTFICGNVFVVLGYTVEEIRAMGNISALLGKGLFTLAELDRQREIRNIDCVITKKDGSRNDYIVTVKRVSIKGGTILYVCRDITDRKRAEKEVLKLNDELEQRVRRRTQELNGKTKELEAANAQLLELDRLKSMFIASMSHELRTPLNSIIGFSSILLDDWFGPLNEEQRSNLETVLRSGRHLLALINDVIDVSKIEAGKLDICVDAFDLFEVVTETNDLFLKEVRDKGLELRVESVHVPMQTDRRRLSQCLINLLGNAVKFSERGVIRVSARVLPRQSPGVRSDGPWIEIAVSDTGIGIRDEDIPKLFNAFVRLTLPRNMSIKGTGLGLYLSAKIVRQILGGEIGVKSAFGQGSRFTIRIPASLQKESG
jgi:PAS domain S-box-containing protein